MSFDSTRIVINTYRPYSTTPWGHFVYLFMKYHTSIWLAPKIPIGTMKFFNSFLHTMSDTNSSIESVEEMIRIMSNQYTFIPFSISAMERLEKNGIGDKYIREILAPQVRRHTGQTIEELSDLALSIALEREEMGSPKPGNRGIYQMMMDKGLKDSGARLLHSSKVTKVRWEEVTEGYENWIVQWQNMLDDEGPHTRPSVEIMDKIIIAAPSNYSELVGVGEMEHQKQFTSRDITHDTKYQPVYVTFFLIPSFISSSFLGGDPSNPLPAQLLPIIDPNHPSNPTYNSIIELSLIRLITINDGSKMYLYRLLSSSAITKLSFYAALGIENDDEIDDEHLKNWTQHEIPHAYPIMQALLPKNIKGDFRLGKNIWTTNGAEGAMGSSVGLSWTVGENVGRLVGRQIIREGVEKRLKEREREGNTERLKEVN
ncbi:hypothetical protein NHQ30_011068 [Ciborinia camelliae]|nr:hypothetical protein NHQ30_011068 [Ciborinia camelliae]